MLRQQLCSWSPTGFAEVRDPSINEKIPREKTGLRTNLYVHVRFDKFGRIAEIQITEQGKDNSTLDRTLAAIGDTLTGICADVNAQRKME